MPDLGTFREADFNTQRASLKSQESGFQGDWNMSLVLLVFWGFF